MNSMIFFDAIISHYSRIWGNSPKYYLWDKGPIEKLPINFRVLEFKPKSDRDMWTYATCGMSNPFDKNPVELHIFSSKKNDALIELLTFIAYYHNNTSRIDINHTINFGKPWQNNSTCKYGFISLPYLDGPELETLFFNNRLVKFYWLIPVTKAEVIFHSKFGTEALEETFANLKINYLDENRKSLV